MVALLECNIFEDHKVIKVTNTLINIEMSYFKIKNYRK